METFIIIACITILNPAVIYTNTQHNFLRSIRQYELKIIFINSQINIIRVQYNSSAYRASPPHGGWLDSPGEWYSTVTLPGLKPEDVMVGGGD